MNTPTTAELLQSERNRNSALFVENLQLRSDVRDHTRIGRYRVWASGAFGFLTGLLYGSFGLATNWPAVAFFAYIAAGFLLVPVIVWPKESR